MAKVYMASDLHVGHESICKYRTQFSSQDEHDNIIIDNLLSPVSKRDTIYLLGDLFFQDSKHLIDKISKNVANLKWILGNHDTDRKVRRDNVKYAATKSNVNIFGLLNYKQFWLSHCPLHESELRGKFNIHGHLHHTTIDDSRYFNVCLEHINYKPILFDEIKDFMYANNTQETCK